MKRSHLFLAVGLALLLASAVGTFARFNARRRQQIQERRARERKTHEITSAAPAQRAMTAGRRSTMAFGTFLTAS